MDEAQQVLVRVAEAHAAPDSRLEQRGGTRQVERDHALVGVPGVDHPVEVLAAAFDLEGAEPLGPGLPERRECRLDHDRVEVPGDDRANPPLVDRPRAGRVELGVRRVLRVPEDERDVACLTRAELEADLVGADRLPAMRDRTRRGPALDGNRPVPAPVRPEERVARGVEGGRRVRAGEVGEMVAPLPVLRRVVDDAVLDLDLADRVVALEVGRIVLRVPQAELDGSEQRHPRGLRPLVGQADAPDLERLTDRDEVARLDADPGALRRDRRVAQAVPALVRLEVAVGRLPAGAPVVAAVVVADVQVSPAQVERRVVVPVAGESPQAGVAHERVAAGRVRDDPEVLVAAEVVDPRQRRVGPRDDVFAVVVVEMAVTHASCFSTPMTNRRPWPPGAPGRRWPAAVTGCGRRHT